MPIKIKEVNYLTVTDLLGEVNVTRQTLWRWRQKGKVPAGHRYRSSQVTFRPEEVKLIRAYANRIEPIKDKVGTSSIGVEMKTKGE